MKQGNDDKIVDRAIYLVGSAINCFLGGLIGWACLNALGVEVAYLPLVGLYYIATEAVRFAIHISRRTNS